jgi:hypothetical protein
MLKIKHLKRLKAELMGLIPYQMPAANIKTESVSYRATAVVLTAPDDWATLAQITQSPLER